MTASVRVLIVDDHFVVREGIRAVIDEQADMAVVAEARNGREAVELFREHRPDVTLMDVRIPGQDGIATTRAILQEWPDARIVVLSTYGAEEQLLRAMQAGAWGYFLKHVEKDDLLAAIRAVHAGERRWPPELSKQATEAMSRVSFLVGSSSSVPAASADAAASNSTCDCAASNSRVR